MRSGAALSMPGIMDSVLNIGLNHDNYGPYLKQYKQLIMQYSEIIHELHLFCNDDDPLDDIEEAYKQETGMPFDQDPFTQLKKACISVLNSAHSARVQRFMAIHNLKHKLPTAIIIQEMVFGNHQSDHNAFDQNTFCGTGILVSRDPNTGQKGMIGEFIPNASGNDLVSGSVTPQTLSHFKDQLWAHYNDLIAASKKLELYFKAPIEAEFTIANNILYFLQVRPMPLSDQATIETSMDFLEEDIFDVPTTLKHIDVHMMNRLLHPQIIPQAHLIPYGQGIAASPGIAVGHLVFDAQDAIQYAAEEKSVILMRHETSPHDIHGMFAANGIVTARGGMTSHAAVSARGMGRTCVTGLRALDIDFKNQLCHIGQYILHKDDIISVDGNTGHIYQGAVEICLTPPSDAFKKLNQLCHKHARLKVRVNADSCTELETARQFGYDGIGLCRSEASFLTGTSRYILQKLILKNILKLTIDIDICELIEAQIAYYTHFFQAAHTQNITIRLLDPPLQEIFTQYSDTLQRLSEDLGVEAALIEKTIDNLHENNPTIGWRGCRLGILYPEIYRLQSEILLKAHRDFSDKITLEIMVPFISFTAEFITIKNQILHVYNDLHLKDTRITRPKIGIMIELPRAALCAGALALQADFLSFGTNDLTQTVLGISRDDAPHFMLNYLKRGLIPFDPFISMDLEGVGVLIKTAIMEARIHNPNILIGLCGEHGADPHCVHFCETIGIDYLSCSAYRIAGARLGAAQAALALKE